MYYTNFILRVIPIGSIIPIPYDYENLGDLEYNFLECDGSTLLVGNHPRLFAEIGTDYGGDGIIDFVIPDMRGLFPMHSDVLEVGNYTLDTIIPHTHPIKHVANDEWWSNYAPWGIKQHSNNDGRDPEGTANYSGQNTGGNETRPDNITVKYCIRYR